jgi:alpha-1,3-glucan synthase
MCFVFGYLMLYGLPEYYRQTPPTVPHFLKTLFRRKLVLWFLASEILRDYWLSGVRVIPPGSALEFTNL